MEKQLNDLVERLISRQEIECCRPQKTAEALKQCIERNYVHVMFKKTGTELGVKLDRRHCKIENGDFVGAKGRILLVGGLTLNYEKVKCIAEIDLSNCEGTGSLEPVSDQDYEIMMNQNNN